MTIMEALQWANNKLRKAGVDSPMLDAEILLAFALDAPKAWLFAHFADKLKTHQEEKFFELVDQREDRMPVAYLVGKKAFYGRDFVVDAHVLIPRPETEVLIECAIKILADKDPERTLIADLGTGSGAIAVTLAAETNLPVIAIDVDEAALEVAKKNGTLLVPETAVDFQTGNLAEPIIRIFKTIRGQTNVQTSSVYPFKTLLLTANLPYLSEVRMDNLQAEVRHEPEQALRAGVDGLDAYWELFRQLRTDRNVLPRDLLVLIETDPEQRQAAEKLILHNFPSAKLAVHKDLHDDDRVIEVHI
ncbi:peptide chain release factor N(5)-glutamine methyltransferase [Patescibacteria group bacterium]|nr:MAG: peptide chain release factor N(5)-glutamine methyltransferase [Patescibacteria group bacterium]